MGDNRQGLEFTEENGKNGVEKPTIKQFISVMHKDSHGNVFQAAMSLLTNGVLYFYNDFILIPGSQR